MYQRILWTCLRDIMMMQKEGLHCNSSQRESTSGKGNNYRTQLSKILFALTMDMLVMFVRIHQKAIDHHQENNQGL